MRFSPFLRILGVFAAVLLGTPALWAGQEQDVTPGPVIYSPDVKIVARTYTMNAIPGGSANKSHLDGQWQCSRVASDGKVYFAYSSHDWKTGGMFCQYDPTTQQVHVLCPDIDVVTGEANAVAAGTNRPHGKLHSDILELNGYLYSATYYGYTGGYYPGGHVWRYQLGSYEAGAPVLNDMGIPVGGGTIYSAFTVDPLNNKAYVISDGCVIKMDTNATGTNKVTLADVGNMWANCFYHFTDSQGNLWTTPQVVSLGALYKFTPAGAMTVYPNFLPQIRRPDNDALHGDQSGRFFSWGDKHGADKFVFQMRQDNSLYEFDASKAWDGDPNDALRKIARIGSGGLDMCLYGDTVYWMQAASPWSTSFNSDDKARDQHLKSVNVITGLIKDWVRIVDQDGRNIWRGEAMSSDGQRVYITGDWKLLRDANDAVIPSDVPYTTIRAHYTTAGAYYDYTNDRPWRGGFFAVINLSSNAAPVVNAGPNQTIMLPDAAALAGTLSDDGQPSPPGTCTAAWSKVSGPGAVTFTNASAPSTTASFSAAGTYVLRLTANDSALSMMDDVTITAEASNVAPTVIVSSLSSIIAPTKSVSLTGTISDDGRPAPPALTCAWTKNSGPGMVVFADPAVATTTATFRNAGTYVLRLTAGDGELSGYDEVTITLDGDLRADFDNDGRVDGMDFLAWQAGFLTTSGATKATGDANADGKVDGLDFLVWQSCFGIWQ